MRLIVQDLKTTHAHEDSDKHEIYRQNYRPKFWFASAAPVYPVFINVFHHLTCNQLTVIQL